MDVLWKELEETLSFEDEPILTYKITLPDFPGTKKSEKRLQRYYRRVEQVWVRYFSEELYLACCEELLEKREKSRLFTPWNLTFLAEIGMFSEDLLSIGLTAQVKKGKAVTNSHFFSHLWDRKKGYPKILSQQEPLSTYSDLELQDKLLDIVKNQEDIRLKENFQSKIQEYFSKNHSFFSKEGIFIYFDQGTIAAPEEGILKFMLFSENYSSTH